MIFDLQDTDETLSMTGAVSGDRITFTYHWYSHTLAKGDVNGDKIEDFIVGAPLASRDPGNPRHEGAVYVFFGKSGCEHTFHAQIPVAQADLTIIGCNELDNVGASVASGDVNGDLIDDIIFGKPNASDPRNARAYIIYGRTDFPPNYTIDLCQPLTGAVEIYDNVGLVRNIGTCVATGRINVDQYDDVIIGNPAGPGGTGTTNTGQAYILYGQSSPPLPSLIYIDEAPPTMNYRRTRILGDIAEGAFGYGISTGHVDTNNLTDVVIGAPVADVGFRDVGVSYLIFGSDTLPDTVNLVTTPLAAVRFTDCVTGAWAGTDNSIGDVNGDGYGDIIIGAPGHDGPVPGVTMEGASYVVKGRDQSGFPTGVYITLCTPDPGNLCQIYGVAQGDETGQCVHAGEISRDGISDVFLAAPFADGPADARLNAGDIYVFYGRGTFFDDFASVLTDSAEAVIYGHAESATDYPQLGSAITTIDINYDGTAEIACGAAWADSPTTTNAGIAYVLYSPDLLRNTDITQYPPPDGQVAQIFFSGSLDPVDDLYQKNISSGFDDPDPFPIVPDTNRPLAFYEVWIPCNVLRLTKSPVNADMIRVFFNPDQV